MDCQYTIEYVKDTVTGNNVTVNNVHEFKVLCYTGIGWSLFGV